MRRREFTEEQIEFIRQGIIDLPTRQLAEAYTKHFNEPLGQTELRRLCKRNGIENPRKANKMQPVGYEVWNDYYKCYMVKVKEISVKGIANKKERDALRNSQWQMKQNIVWEQANNKKLPWRWIVVFLDGDRTNYDPENLYAVPLQNAGTIKRMGLDSEFAEVKKTALKYSELHYAIAGRKHERANDNIQDT